MSAGNLKHSAVGVAGRGDLIQGPLLQRDGDTGWWWLRRKVRVMLRAGDESANSPLFPRGSSWVKAFTSFSVLVSNLDRLPEEIYQLLGTVGESVWAHSQRGESRVQLQNSFPACSTLCWRASFVSALLQMKSQRRSLLLSLLVLHPPTSSWRSKTCIF